MRYMGYLAEAARNLAPMSSVMVSSIRKVMEAERQEDAHAGRKTAAV
jgi:hypothetical protein